MPSIFENYVHDEFMGRGGITFRDGRTYTVNFQIYLFNSGSLIGSVWFTEVDVALNDELKRNEIFNLDGETDHGLKILTERCAFYSFTTRHANGLPTLLLTASLFVLLTKIFLKILPADDTFLKEYNNVKWKLLT